MTYLNDFMLLPSNLLNLVMKRVKNAKTLAVCGELILSSRLEWHRHTALFLGELTKLFPRHFLQG